MIARTATPRTTRRMPSSVATIITAAIVATTAAAHAGSETITETFDDMSNVGGWQFAPFDTFQSTGGNPGWYKRVSGLDTFAPMPRTNAPADNNPFIGNFRDNGVTSIGIDLTTFAVDFSAGGRPLALMLMHNNGTPSNPSDDTAAYFLHDNNVPLPGQGWLSYDFDIPSDATDLPTGWTLINMGDLGAPPNHTWDEVIQSVAQVRYHYGNPEFFFIFQMWTLGMDNPRITMETESTPGDLDGNGTVDGADLAILLGAWGACADCDNCDADLDDNCTVDGADLAILLGNWR